MPKSLLPLLSLMLILPLTRTTQAAGLQPFMLDYKASYGNMEAVAMRSLGKGTETGAWEMKSKVEV